VEVFDAVRTVLAVRRYRDAPVPRELVDRIIEAGRLSASSINLQPWHFVVIGERDTLRRIGEIMHTGSYVADASFAVVVLVAKASPYGASDGSRAIQNMILTAWSEGVGSNWVGFGPMPAVEKLVGAPRTHEGLAVVPFGYPAATGGSGRKKRKPIGTVASRERVGTPFA
jgi:nitroreductase